MDNRIKSASGLNVLAGIWIIFSPWIFGYAGLPAAMWSSVVVGVLIAAFAALRASSPASSPGLSWFNALLGAWVIVTPWIFTYEENAAATWDKVITGAIVLCLALISASGGTSHPVHPAQTTAVRH
jgi:predicted anti-sigma-YlaC factor YlaD